MSDPLSGKRMIVGLGAHKAGTSWLQAQLARHKTICMSSPKEMHYFDTAYRPEAFGDPGGDTLRRLRQATDLLVEGVDHAAFDTAPELQDRLRTLGGDKLYMDFFRKRVRASDTAFGEMTPAYAALDTHGFAALRDCHPDVRVIFILRDPLARLISQLRHYRRNSNRMRHYAERLGRPVAGEDIIDLLQWPEMAARRRYDVTLRRLDETFAPQNVLIGFYETMFSSAFADRLAAFVGVPDIVFDVEERVNAAPDSEPADEAWAAELAPSLAPVYAACRARFGDQIPPSWRS